MKYILIFFLHKAFLKINCITLNPAQHKAFQSLGSIVRYGSKTHNCTFKNSKPSSIACFKTLTVNRPAPAYISGQAALNLLLCLVFDVLKITDGFY